MSRPEHTGPPEDYYNAEEAFKYTQNTRIIEIQTQMAERAVELMNLPKDQPSFVLDIGCGSGLSGEVLSERGHEWIGMDISRDMLEVARERECEGDLFHHDMGDGFGFRPGTFDGAISISAVQWLFQADKKWHNPRKRIRTFFESLYTAMSRGARVVLQFYPESPQQIELLTHAAMRSGFTGGLVVDYPESTRAKKYFLCLFAGIVSQAVPTGLTAAPTRNPQQAQFVEARNRGHGKPRKGSHAMSRAEWVRSKKERHRKQGKEVTADSKYTGRKRKQAF